MNINDLPINLTRLENRIDEGKLQFCGAMVKPALENCVLSTIWISLQQKNSL